MDEMHSPATQKFKYMISDLNDHHNFSERHIEGRERDYIKMKIWFGGLRNELTTNVALDGEILYGELKCLADKDLKEEELIRSAPEEASLKRFRKNNDNTKFVLTIHQSDDNKTKSRQEYVEQVREVKSKIMSLTEVAGR